MEIISAAVMLFLIMDPLGNLPVMLSILRHIEPKRRRIIMVRELLIALVILLAFLFGGQSLLNFLHVSAETVSISGGIILFLIAIRMIFPSAGWRDGAGCGRGTLHCAYGDPDDCRTVGAGILAAVV